MAYPLSPLAFEESSTQTSGKSSSLEAIIRNPNSNDELLDY